MEGFGKPGAGEAHAEFGGLSPKTESLPGSLAFELRRCGKPGCRCARGLLHGPFAYRYWYEAGRRRKRYVPLDRVAEVATALARWRERHPPAWATRELLAELRRLGEEATG